jgi:hypothetical protein
LVAVVCLAASGCVAHQPVGRPPSVEEIERINAYGQAHGDLRLEYVSPQPGCAAGSCGGEQRDGGNPEEITRIVSSTAQQTVVQTEDGRSWTLRTETITAAHARNRARGAIVGALVGASVGIVLTVALAGLLQSSGLSNSDPSAPPPSPSSTSDVFRFGAILTLTQAAAWAGLGALIGGRESFDFGAPPPEPEPTP